MPEIKLNSTVETLINTFVTTPETQQTVLDILTEAGENEIGHQPGFVSSSLHRSADGTRVVNYVQWESREAWQAMLADPGAIDHIEKLREISSPDPNWYEVVGVFAPGS
jgi:heme-degrading monooxygenase HmoA